MKAVSFPSGGQMRCTTASRARWLMYFNTSTALRIRCNIPITDGSGIFKPVLKAPLISLARSNGCWLLSGTGFRITHERHAQ
jgi:hypothetical protein